MFFFWVFVVVALFVLTLWAVTVAGRLRPADEAVVAAAGQASQPLAVAFVVLLTAALLGALAWAGFMAWHMTGGWRGWMPHMGWTGNPVAQTPVVTEAQEVTVRMRGGRLRAQRPYRPAGGGGDLGQRGPGAALRDREGLVVGYRVVRRRRIASSLLLAARCVGVRLCDPPGDGGCDPRAAGVAAGVPPPVRCR